MGLPKAYPENSCTLVLGSVKRKGLGILVLGLVFLSGCSSAQEYMPANIDTNPRGTIPLIQASPKPPPDDVTWIKPAKVTVGYIIDNLVEGIGPASAQIAVYNASRFPQSGVLVIEDERIYYKAHDLHAFSGLARGYDNTASTIHRAGVEVSYDKGDFVAGAEADATLTIHNGETYRTMRFQVFTENDTDTSVDLAGLRLHAASLASITQLISSNLKDNVRAVSYDPYRLSVHVVGLTPATPNPNYGNTPLDPKWIQATRIMSVTYKADVMFQVAFGIPSWGTLDYAQAISEVRNWVTISDPTPILGPQETRDVEVVLKMPVGAKAPMQKYQFWVTVMPEPSGSGGVQVQGKSVMTWAINMKQ